MDDRRLGMVIRARRHQRGWRLVDLAFAARVGATACSLMERGHASRLTVHTARAIAAAVDVPLRWDIGWVRQEVDRLLDADHSVLVARWMSVLARRGWIVRTEVSFNRYGDRGRIDLLAFHAHRRVLLVVEVKTALVDAQALLGGLDVKARVAPHVGRELGWNAALVVPAIVFAEGSTVRRRVRELAPLFARYALRGHAVGPWLRDPVADPGGILVFSKLSSNAGSDVRKAGRRRVRRSGPFPRSRDAAVGSRSAAKQPNDAHSAG